MPIAWALDRTGLYAIDDGVRAPVPISHFQENIWNGIASVPLDHIHLIDDPEKSRVALIVVADNDSTTRYIWDYSRGHDPYAAQFSADAQFPCKRETLAPVVLGEETTKGERDGSR